MGLCYDRRGEKGVGSDEVLDAGTDRIIMTSDLENPKIVELSRSAVPESCVHFYLFFSF